MKWKTRLHWSANSAVMKLLGAHSTFILEVVSLLAQEMPFQLKAIMPNTLGLQFRYILQAHAHVCLRTLKTLEDLGPLVQLVMKTQTEKILWSDHLNFELRIDGCAKISRNRILCYTTLTRWNSSFSPRIDIPVMPERAKTRERMRFRHSRYHSLIFFKFKSSDISDFSHPFYQCSLIKYWTY